MAFKNQFIYTSINQTGSNVEIQLAEPLKLFNITSLDNLYYNYDFNGTSVLNSCIFNSTYYSFDLSKFKNIDYSFPDYYNPDYKHFFSICSNLSFTNSQSGAEEYGKFSFPTGYLNTESFKLGINNDNYKLKLTYTNPHISCPNIFGGTDLMSRDYYFICDERQEFNFTSSKYASINDCNVDVYIKTKYVCPYKNNKRTPIEYSLIEPNILRYTLDENSSNLISVNGNKTIDLSIIQFKKLLLEPVINNCENNGDVITVKGIFFKNVLSNYTFYYGGYQIKPPMITSFNSTTLVVNSTGYVDNNFFISLFGIKSESYPILKPQQQMVLSSRYDHESGFFNSIFIYCKNCIGANTKGLLYNYTVVDSSPIEVSDIYITLNDDSEIYIEAPIYPYKRSSALQLPTDFNHVSFSGNEIFEFNVISTVSISGSFIPKMYNNQAYIIGKLEFSNGTICILDYKTLSNRVFTEGNFSIPSGYGNGNFSIYIKDKLVHLNPFSYTTSKWISSVTQNLEKVQLHLSFPVYFFQITSIKYNNKNGIDLDYTLIEPNIISFTLNANSTNVLSFNNDYHIETLTNELNFRPIIYNYSIQNDVITMEGVFMSNLSNYKFYLDDSKNSISSDQITYFDSSRLSLIMNKASHVYVYIDDYSFTKVPDLTITSNQDQLLFTCSNCLGGSININEPQTDQDSQFSQIGTIVKQFNTKTIFNKYNIFTFTKDSKTIVIQPPLPSNVIVDGSLAQFSTFSNNTILVSADFLMDKYNGFDNIDFQFQFDNGTIHSAKKQFLSKSDQNYRYQINAPFAYGSGNFSVFVTFENRRKFIINPIPFYYPKKPIINSISKIKDGNIKMNGDGFFNVIVRGTFKANSLYKENRTLSETIDCYPEIINQNINCQFSIHEKLEIYFDNDPIEIQLRSHQNSNFQFEPVYTQTYSDDEMLSSDISLHSVFSKLVATIFILISILLQ
ncbi:hypothetical protein DDB_G0283229 [Dictyostelium discoideum AX4]|uniref:MRH domain-containing protein n=1 Tax=Dictyostelium discoideum TaxID=44689 RepID=Q54RG4_DICDI|nr:hypothetical protein DDB_G0283229 [Dictyostelium discoideum AX4]EAL65853.1 hypothetical protein DDB_G0283229 [Dictyostelium discoideum AX4]|eukprot:XP_639181.1 hypothetical protein DDB_G0283229 [Dictyostelium discoideum AX4]